MNERPRSPDQVAEVTELTWEHWKEIIDRFKVRDEASQKAHDVASAKLFGRIQNPNPYLGRRHWSLIRRISTTDKIKTPRLFPLPSKVSFVPNKKAEEAAYYAENILRHERKTVNDTLAGIDFGNDSLYFSEKDIQSNNVPEDKFLWADGVWKGSRASLQYCTGYDRSQPIPGFGEPIRNEEVAARVRQAWHLLDEGDCPDILHTSPYELNLLVLKLAKEKPEKYGRVELEVPQAS